MTLSPYCESSQIWEWKWPCPSVVIAVRFGNENDLVPLLWEQSDLGMKMTVPLLWESDLGMKVTVSRLCCESRSDVRCSVMMWLTTCCVCCQTSDQVALRVQRGAADEGVHERRQRSHSTEPAADLWWKWSGGNLTSSVAFRGTKKNSFEYTAHNNNSGTAHERTCTGYNILLVNLRPLFLKSFKCSSWHFVCVCVCVCMHACVCVCVRVRDWLIVHYLSIVLD